MNTSGTAHALLAQRLDAIAAALARAETSSAALTEASLERAQDPGGEGGRAFTVILAESARASARASDLLRSAGMCRSPLEGIPVSVKDLCDVAGIPTLAGSVVRAHAPAATRDACVVSRLRRAGAVIVGKTNMTEFAVGTPGTNPHYGTPRNPWDRASERVCGGSSCGAAASVAYAMAAAGLGTDTAGSVRVPAALCGLVGFKPTARRVSLTGLFPFSPSLDSAGPLVRSVACARTFDHVVAAPGTSREAPGVPIRGLRLGVLETLVNDDMEDAVAHPYRQALAALSAAGAHLEDLALPELREVAARSRDGGIAGAEAWACHAQTMEHQRHLLDPRVAEVLERAAGISAREYIELLELRERLRVQSRHATRRFDAVLMPAAPMVAPTIASLDDPARWHRVRALLLRNNVIANVLDRPALTVPCHRPGDPPAGLMLMGETLGDEWLLAAGEAVERTLSP